MVKKNRKIILALLDSQYSQRELAKKSGVHESRVSLIVNGRFIPSKSEADRIAKVLNRETSDLFKTVA